MSAVIGIVAAAFVLLMIVGALSVTVRGQRRRAGPIAAPPGPHRPGLVNGAHQPRAAEPGFRVHPEPGFTVVNRTGGQRTGPPVNAGAGRPGKPGTAGFTSAGVTQNLTAICKLTGVPAGGCTCERHRNQRDGKR